MKDYSGFSTAEFKTVFWRYLDCDFEIFADRIQMHERDLKKLVVSPSYAFIGMKQADEILLSLGQNVSDLISIGELTPVPARDSRNSALKMIADEIGIEKETEDGKIILSLDDIPDDEIEARIEVLLETRRKLCVVSEEQAERLRKDAERTTQRRQREKAPQPA